MELLGQDKIDHHQRQVAILSQDSFYRVLTPEQKVKALKGQFNFDHPGSPPPAASEASDSPKGLGWGGFSLSLCAPPPCL